MSGTAALLRQTSDHPMMPFFFQKSHSSGSTELGFKHTPTHSIHAIQPAHCSTMVRPNSSWFCSASVCGSSTMPPIDSFSQILDQPKSPLSSTTISGRHVFYSNDQCHIPAPILGLFVYLAQQGVRVSDMFRRPGNVAQMRIILERFSAGESVSWEEYNVYTVANVAKKLLLSIPDGLFGPAGEAELLATANHPSCAAELLDLSSTCSTPVEQTVTTEEAQSFRKPGAGRLTGVGAEHKSVSFQLHPDDVREQMEEELRLWTRTSGTSLLPWPVAAVRQLHQLYEVGERRVAVCLKVLEALPPSHQQMIILMLGILHQLIFRSTSIEDTWSSLVSRANACVAFGSSNGGQPPEESTPNIPLLTLAEGVVKSVAGTLFHTCSSSVSRVEHAAQVLRSLVVYFPTMGDSITRFYSDAIAGRLSTSEPEMTAAASGDPVVSQLSGSDRGGCVLCPKADHSLYFDQPPGTSRERSPCPSNLLQVASRLFCMGSSPTTPVHSRQTSSSSAPGSTTSKRHGRKTNMKKSWADMTSGVVSKSTELNAKQKPPSPHAPVSSDPCLQGDASRSDRIHGPLTSVDDPISKSSPPTRTATETQHTERPMLLRRNQSRYRSLRRRQMENLSRRAEWFLGPTVVPVVHLKPGWRSCESQQTRQEASYTDAHLVVQSAISLLELAGDTMAPKTTSSLTATGPPLLTTPPRLLFTASTGELVQAPDTSESRRSDSDRKRLLSVGSSMTGLSTESFVSIHSAPPPVNWTQADYQSELQEQPKSISSFPERARSVSPPVSDSTKPSFPDSTQIQTADRFRRNSAQSSMQTSFVEPDVVVIINEPSDQE